ncbi:MAG: hypothetical protein RDU59_12330 [Thermodesulfobacteriota bacterium]|nr:hypothetical protein [Thermodesulfobacteriota bacterium]
MDIWLNAGDRSFPRGIIPEKVTERAGNAVRSEDSSMERGVLSRDEFSPSNEAADAMAARSGCPSEGTSGGSLLGIQGNPPAVTDFTHNSELHKSKIYIVGETSTYRHQKLCMPGIGKCVGFEPDKEQARPILPGFPVISSPGRVTAGDMPSSGVILKTLEATPEQQKKFWESEVAGRLKGKAPHYNAFTNNCIDWVNNLFREAEASIPSGSISSR